ncbi:MAG: acetyl-CoA C-acyltransferase [Candidatus Omnitrophota bacterium]|nr:acetyl-CoA C-acyltransferase [Candidatus Omnitrophota bacterium]
MKPVGLKRGARTPFVKMGKEFAHLNAVDLSVRLVDGILEKRMVPQDRIQHVIWGMVVADPNIYSIGREVVLGSRLDNRVEAYSLSRACATSLQAAANAVSYYQTFPEEPSVTLVGGVESFSSARPVLTDEAAVFFKRMGSKMPVAGKIKSFFKTPLKKFLPVAPSAKEYSTGLTMGEHCELMVKEFKIARERQDRFALTSHQNAAAARSKVAAQLIPVEGTAKDTLIRDNTSLEALKGLPTAFDRSPAGTITAGNASPFTDGASALFCVSPALESQVPPDAYLTDFEFVGVEPKDGLLMGPGKAMLRVLERNRLRWEDLDYIEVHEAFAGQVLCNVEAVNNPAYRAGKYGSSYDAGRLDEIRLNPWGSSIAYGHPFGATGARMLNQAVAFLQETKGRRALLGICTAGALAGSALIERRSS